MRFTIQVTLEYSSLRDMTITDGSSSEYMAAMKEYVRSGCSNVRDGLTFTAYLS